tara:strand:+ start:133 stop:603 length:471 start_codon:yes stop_codon:yes gene_type:complete
MYTQTIYKITDKDNKIYYGTTSNSLKQRLQKHKGKGNGCNTRHMDKDSMQIEMIEEHMFYEMDKIKQFIKDRESHYIRNFECINQIIPNRTRKESSILYRKNNKPKITEHNANYRLMNKDKLSEVFHCACGSNYTYSNKTRHFRTQVHLSYVNNCL